MLKMDSGPAEPSPEGGDPVSEVSEVSAVSDPSGPSVPPHVPVGPFQVCDAASDAVVDAVVRGSQGCAGRRPWVAFALHVGGLNSRTDPAYVAAMSRADLVYADGVSVVLLARLAGGSRTERAGTTDIGWDVLRELGRALGRPPRVALIGGPEGLTQRAGAVFEAEAGVEVVATEHGYHSDWTEVLRRLAASGCDVLFVGLGAPFEMTWVDTHRAELPPCLVMTCGGWFGFVVADEQRAPQWAQSAGLEWVFRVKQAPRRLARRYATGVGATAALAVRVVVDRSQGRRRAGAPRPPSAGPRRPGA